MARNRNFSADRRRTQARASNSADTGNFNALIVRSGNGRDKPKKSKDELRAEAEEAMKRFKGEVKVIPMAEPREPWPKK